MKAQTKEEPMEWINMEISCIVYKLYIVVKLLIKNEAKNSFVFMKSLPFLLNGLLDKNHSNYC